MARRATLPRPIRSPGLAVRRHVDDAAGQVVTYDPGRLEDVPAPARRLLQRALPAGRPLGTTVELQMTGRIKLGGWLPFRARQLLQAGQAFVWEPVIGRFPTRVRGADTFLEGRGTLDFRLWGLVPIVGAAGPDVDRSAAGRLAAETVAWVPHALLPDAGAVWTDGDDTTAMVTVPVARTAHDIHVTVDRDGVVRELGMERWGDPNESGFGCLPFGGRFGEHATFDGVTIASAGSVGWWWGTARQDEGVFFEFAITAARFRG